MIFLAYQNNTSLKALPWCSRTSPQDTTLDAGIHSSTPHTPTRFMEFFRLPCPQDNHLLSHLPSADLSWQDLFLWNVLARHCPLLAAAKHRGDNFILYLQYQAAISWQIWSCFQTCPKPNNLTETNGAANALLPETRSSSNRTLIPKLLGFFSKKVSRIRIKYWIFF